MTEENITSKYVSKFYEQLHEDHLNEFRKHLKKFELSIDDCRPEGLVHEAMELVLIGNHLGSESRSLTRKQFKEMKNLNRMYKTQLQRLTIGKVCECKQN